MRIIPLEGAKARYERLKLLAVADDFGQELTPQATAPFTVRWDAERRITSLFVDETFVGDVKIQGDGAIVEVRDAYPARFDHAVLRAVRNAADLTDEVGRLKRAMEKSKDGEAGLFTRTPTAFAPHIQDVERMHRALRGAEVLNNKISVELYGADDQDGYFLISAHFGRAQHNFTMRFTQGGLRVSPYEGDAYGLRESALNELLNAGLALYEERMVPERLEAACRKLIAETGEVDAESIVMEYRNAGKTRNDEVVLKVGPFSTFKKGYWGQHRFNGIRFAQSTRDPLMCLPKGLIVDADLLGAAGRNLLIRWQAATIGKRISDYPQLTEDLIAARIDDCDFGYDT